MYILVYKFRFEKIRYVGPFTLMDEAIKYMDNKGWKYSDTFSSCTIEKLEGI